MGELAYEVVEGVGFDFGEIDAEINAILNEPEEQLHLLLCYNTSVTAGQLSWLEHRTHKPAVASSNLAPATRIELDLLFRNGNQNSGQPFLHLWSAQFLTPSRNSPTWGPRKASVIRLGYEFENP